MAGPGSQVTRARRIPSLAAALVAGVLAASGARADAVPPPGDPARLPASAAIPWTDSSDVPIPSWATSVVPQAPATAHENPAVYERPGAIDLRRGSVRSGVPLPLFAATRGAGCQGRWYMVGPLAWLCSDVAELSDALPNPPPALRPRADGLPFRYAFAGRDGAWGYVDPEHALEDSPDSELEPGWGVALVREQTVRGELWGLTRRGRWIALRELAVARPIAFHGEELPEGKLDIAWVLPDHAPVYAAPEGGKVAGTRVRFEALRVVGERTTGRGAMLEVTKFLPGVAPDPGPVDGGGAHAEPTVWIRASDVRRPHATTPPAEITGGAAPDHERWIDVELASQTLTAYEGGTPVFSTMVSTGIGPQGSALATPVGTHRIWVKLATSTMDNVDDDDSGASTGSGNDDPEHRYSIEDVPWVQFFSKGVALHAAFWHRSFGHIHSHGCVNLAPIDAARLFTWTSPHLPSAWSAVLPSTIEPGTVIRVR